MLTIRFSRVGKKKAPVYRIVVMPKHKDPWAPSTEILGHYNPRKQPKEFVVNVDRVKYWLSQGAEASNSVWNLLIEQKIIEGAKRSVTNISKTRAGKMETKAAEAKAKADEAAAKKEKEAEEVKEVEEAAPETPAEEPKPEEPAA